MTSTSCFPALPADARLLSIADALEQYDPEAPRRPLCWVEGEVTDLSRAESGHRYFTLSDGVSEAPCVLFKSTARGISARAEEGLWVAVRATVQPCPKGSHLEFDVQDLLVRSVCGPRRSALEAVREALAAEGLFDDERKRALPERPTCIGIVTSPAGSVIHDIRRILQIHAPGVRTRLAPARVTGEGAADEIAAAIRELSGSGAASPIIVARGGGSSSDLDAFNAEAVARAIAESSVPVISAVGHETDHTIADQVADARCATPTEAALLAVQHLPRTADLSEPGSELRLQIGAVSITIVVPGTPLESQPAL